MIELTCSTSCCDFNQLISEIILKMRDKRMNKPMNYD